MTGLTAERVLWPLDGVRRRGLALLGPAGARLVRDRELRVAAAFSGAVVLALAATALAPLWLMALGPILLGVPHLMSDVRYLVLRPRLHRRRLLAICAGLPLLVAAFNAGVLAGLVACAAVLIVSRTTPARRLLGLAAVAILCWGAALAGPLADLAFAHLHNFAAVAFFWLWRPRAKKLHLAPLALFGLASAAVLLGALDPTWGRHALSGPPGLLGPDRLAALAPGLSEALGARLVLLFAFAQSVHYAVWLRLVPEEDRGRPTPRSFARTLRALQADFGAAGLGLCAAAAFALAGWAAFDLLSAYDGYLRAAVFHGHLELAALTLLFAEGGSSLKALSPTQEVL